MKVTTVNKTRKFVQGLSGSVSEENINAYLNKTLRAMQFLILFGEQVDATVYIRKHVEQTMEQLGLDVFQIEELHLLYMEVTKHLTDSKLLTLKDVKCTAQEVS